MITIVVVLRQQDDGVIVELGTANVKDQVATPIEERIGDALKNLITDVFIGSAENSGMSVSSHAFNSADVKLAA